MTLRDIETRLDALNARFFEIVSKIAGITQQLGDVERRCGIKENKIDSLNSFRDKLIGYSMASSAIITILINYILR